MNTRRKLIVALGGSALAAPLSSFAQQQAGVPRIVFIGPGDSAASVPNLSAFRGGMRENGLTEGKHYLLDAEYSQGDYERFPFLVSKALERKPAIIMVQTIESVRAAQQATRTVPILFVSTNDPVGSGLVATLARPGGNTTGLSTQHEEAVSKFVELLRELLPRAKQVAVLVNARNPSGRTMFERTRLSAGERGIAARLFEVNTAEGFDTVFDLIVKYKPDALMVPADAAVYAQRDRISEFGLRNRIPLIVGTSAFVASGGLIGYGPSSPDIFRRAAMYARKILDGASPGDLPVEQPTKFELTVNAKTAKTLGITVPRTILVRANRMIE